VSECVYIYIYTYIYIYIYIYMYGHVASAHKYSRGAACVPHRADIDMSVQF
jgi:hypothetical protein